MGIDSPTLHFCSMKNAPLQCFIHIDKIQFNFLKQKIVFNPYKTIAHELCKNIKVSITKHWMKKFWCSSCFFILDGQFGIFCQTFLLPPRFDIQKANMVFFENVNMKTMSIVQKFNSKRSQSFLILSSKVQKN